MDLRTFVELLPPHVPDPWRGEEACVCVCVGGGGGGGGGGSHRRDSLARKVFKQA